MNIEVDLYSDTKTRPSTAMREAMAEAEVGDEQAFEDPTVLALEERVAALLDKEAALFLPSGTMANQIALRLHCRPGDEVLIEASSHPLHAESGGPAANAGVMLRALEGERGQLRPDQVEAAIRGSFRHNPMSRLIWVENTTNFGGGTCWSLETLQELRAIADRHGLAMHMDGARLLNAVAAGTDDAASLARPFDSVWIDFSKGLGAPVGACLAGSKAFIHDAWRAKQQLGGAMRQAGIVAAGALFALEHHVDRLKEDHDNARVLARGIEALPGLALLNAPIETNLVFFSTEGAGLKAAELADRLLERGVRIGARGPMMLRACTHLDVDRAAVERALEALAASIEQ